jgi:cell division protein FtsI (penicillin-binding protein 3)
MSAIANGGNLMRPYLVERILDDEGRELQRFEPQTVRRVISPDTAAKITRMMETVTEEGGTGTKAAIDGFRVAGKTGTAQKVDPVTRAYSPSKRIGSFVGFVPSDKPRLTIAVIIDEPQGVKYGGIIAAPAFQGIALNSLAYMKVTPRVEVGKKPKAVDTKTAQATENQTPDHDSMAEGDALEEPDGGTAVMPDFRGMSMRRVLQVMEKRNLNIRLKGSGRAAEQSPPPGQVIRSADKVWVRFAPSA